MIVRRTQFLRDPKPEYFSEDLTPERLEELEREYRSTHNDHTPAPGTLDTIGSLPLRIPVNDPRETGGNREDDDESKPKKGKLKVSAKKPKYDKEKNIRTGESKKYSKGATRKFSAKKKNGEEKSGKYIKNREKSVNTSIPPPKIDPLALNRINMSPFQPPRNRNGNMRSFLPGVGKPPVPGLSKPIPPDRNFVPKAPGQPIAPPRVVNNHMVSMGQNGTPAKPSVSGFGLPSTGRLSAAANAFLNNNRIGSGSGGASGHSSTSASSYNSDKYQAEAAGLKNVFTMLMDQMKTMNNGGNNSGNNSGGNSNQKATDQHNRRIEEDAKLSNRTSAINSVNDEAWHYYIKDSPPDTSEYETLFKKFKSLGDYGARVQLFKNTKILMRKVEAIFKQHSIKDGVTFSNEPFELLVKEKDFDKAVEIFNSWKMKLLQLNKKSRHT